MDELLDIGNSFIDDDLKKLRKRYRSIDNDLMSYFIYHKNKFLEYQALPCEIARTDEYIICKQRVAITTPNLNPAKGCRLWFAIKNHYYIKCLIYSVQEEKYYTKSVCFKIIWARLKAFVNDP